MLSKTSKIWKVVTLLLAIGWGATAAQAVPIVFNIQINPGSGLSSNSAALAAFNRAAQQWVNRISDPFTVFIDADLTNLGSGSIIGQASSRTLEASFDTVRNAMVMDSLDEADDAIVAFLPTSQTFNANIPVGGSLSGNALFNKANAKALGFAGLDTRFGNNDGTIDFNSGFAFDFDNRDGVGAGLVDFETVAAHEIGHVLGFVSIVDSIDGGQIAGISPYTFDLFRFENNVAGSDPGTDPGTVMPTDFTTARRYLRTGGNAIFDDAVTEYGLSTGARQGDGSQASHWKDDNITGATIGIMDPTLAPQQVIRVSESDLRVMDLIGYEVQPLFVTAVPEPGTVTLMGIGIVGLIGARRRKKKERQP